MWQVACPAVHQGEQLPSIRPVDGDGPVLAHRLQQRTQLAAVVLGGAWLREQLTREAQVVSQVFQGLGDAPGGLLELDVPLAPELRHECLPVTLDEPHGPPGHAAQGQQQQEDGKKGALHRADQGLHNAKGMPAVPAGGRASRSQGPW